MAAEELGDGGDQGGLENRGGLGEEENRGGVRQRVIGACRLIGLIMLRLVPHACELSVPCLGQWSSSRASTARPV